MAKWFPAKAVPRLRAPLLLIHGDEDGTIPIQIDYSDYREVAGVKMPFHWIVTWTGGQSTMELNAVQANVSMEAAKFSKPAPAVVTKAVAR